jgi:hypothetical protein
MITVISCYGATIYHLSVFIRTLFAQLKRTQILGACWIDKADKEPHDANDYDNDASPSDEEARLIKRCGIEKDAEDNNNQTSDYQDKAAYSVSARLHPTRAVEGSQSGRPGAPWSFDVLLCHVGLPFPCFRATRVEFTR